MELVNGGDLGALETTAKIDKIPELTLQDTRKLTGPSPFKCSLFAMERKCGSCDRREGFTVAPAVSGLASLECLSLPETTLLKCS